MSTAFIIGSPRSGTTVLAEILGRSPDIAQWYEPYFIWDRHLPGQPTDVRGAEAVTAAVYRYVRREFAIYQRKSGKEWIVDKSPEHSFQIPFVNRIFPGAKWIHLLRDGRDVTLSIHKEWRRRRHIVHSKDYAALARTAMVMLRRQPFIRYKIKALAHELRGRSFRNPNTWLNKTKWRGEPGWGPRFPGWAAMISKVPPLEFNAYQWLRTIERITDDAGHIASERRLEIRYEQLLADPKGVLQTLFAFLGLAPPAGFYRAMPPLRRHNTQKWRREFSRTQREQISPILTPKLLELGYETDPKWASREACVKSRLNRYETASPPRRRTAAGGINDGK
jgi:hypothetical protein